MKADLAWQYCDTNHKQINKEFAEMDKHEVLCNIASNVGSDPCNLALAEEIFEKIKYQTTQYVLKHEFHANQEVSDQLSLWLEEQCEPSAAKPLKSFMQKYLHPFINSSKKSA